MMDIMRIIGVIAELAVMVGGYGMFVWLLVWALERGKEKLFAGTPRRQRFLLLIGICTLPFAGHVLLFPFGGIYDLFVLLPALAALVGLVNAMTESLPEYLLVQTLLGLIAWGANWAGAVLYIAFVSNDALTQRIFELFLFLELTVIVVSAVILAIRKCLKNRRKAEA